MIRVLLAGLAGGFAMFMCGAIAHMVFDIESRAMMPLPSDASVADAISRENLQSGMYVFPNWMEGRQLKGAELEAWQTKFVERYKAGPSGFLIVMPKGEDPMGPTQLGGEFLGNVIAAVIVAWIIAQFSATSTFLKRWLAIVLVAPASWFSLTFSFFLWYRFPFAFALDGLIGAIFEWVVAGAIIAYLVRPQQTSPTNETVAS